MEVMMKKSLKIFIACFLGIICGGLVLSKITGQFSFLRLIIGMIVGGPLGYLAYDFKTVIKIVPKAWNAVKGWKPNKEWWRDFGPMLWAAASIISTITIGMLAYTSLVAWAFEESGLADAFKFSAFIYAGSVVLFTPLLAFGLMGLGVRTRKEHSSGFKRYNPFRVYLWLVPKYILISLFLLIKYIVSSVIMVFSVIIRVPGFLLKIIVTLARFIKTLVIMIHRDERLVCMFDTMLGIVIFYFWGNLILSAICGGLLAVLNWQIISVRILHLNASKIKNA